MDAWSPYLETLTDAEMEKKIRDQDRNTRSVVVYLLSMKVEGGYGNTLFQLSICPSVLPPNTCVDGGYGLLTELKGDIGILCSIRRSICPSVPPPNTCVDMYGLLTDCLLLVVGRLDEGSINPSWCTIIAFGR